jgi:N-acetyl-alpha-D-muramate 1-phosphate uridylyltransferase
MGGARLPQREKKRYAAAREQRRLHEAFSIQRRAQRQRLMQTVILAGGLATRLGALTAKTPKSLLPIAGRPFIAWQLEALARSGFDEVLLCVGHLSSQIRDFVGSGSSYGLSVDYSEDGPELLGTGGALRRALPALAPTFLVTYGDSYLPFDYSAPLRDLDSHPEALGTMSVFKNDGLWDASNTQIGDDRVLRYEKGSTDPRLDHIDYGATALRKSVISAIDAGAKLGLDAVQRDLAARGLMRAFRASRRFYEIGSAAGISDLEAELRSSPRP